jgi:hypothetical protein
MLRGYDLRAQARRKKAEQLAAELEQRSRRQEVRTERLNLLRAMEREYEGFGQSVRRVMEAAHRGELRGDQRPGGRSDPRRGPLQASPSRRRWAARCRTSSWRARPRPRPPSAFCATSARAAPPSCR